MKDKYINYERLITKNGFTGLGILFFILFWFITLIGHNFTFLSIVIYSIDENTGKLAYIGTESTQGSWPRNFAIDPTGSFLLAENFGLLKT